jgi:hypothetical protein
MDRTARNNPGFPVIAAATSRPALEPPKIASLLGVVMPSRHSHSAALVKSSTAVWRVAPRAASCHELPNSPPPRIWGTTKIAPNSSMIFTSTEYCGVNGAPKPPYPVMITGWIW